MGHGVEMERLKQEYLAKMERGEAPEDLEEKESMQAPAKFGWGMMNADFDGAEYGENCLTVTKGEYVYLRDGGDDAWASGQVQRGTVWHSGWIPRSYWIATPGRATDLANQ